MAGWLGGKGVRLLTFSPLSSFPALGEAHSPGWVGERLEWEVSGPLEGRGAAPSPTLPSPPSPQGRRGPRSSLHPATPACAHVPFQGCEAGLGRGGLRSSLCEVASAGHPAAAPGVCLLLSSSLPFLRLGLQMTL